ncbi:DUF1559 domain-containing protein [bacterium]|jgi:hypothetical protein|nr:DUF1559 domain-containing protein [Planctomicrobium sp.]MDA7527724.1 DUF1559 domain-containing protein [bacterium]MDA7527736.1 DUF1559 domain-containing protein [bacterium]
MNRLEIIVCIIIFLAVASLLVSNVKHNREVARRTQCLNNMRNIGIAVQTYATEPIEDFF